MAKKTCPQCGAPIESSRSICPNCRTVLRKQSPLTPFLIVGGVVAAIIIVVAVLLLASPAQSTPLSVTELTVLPTPGAAQNPSTPACTIAIAGSKVPPSSVQLRVMTSTCLTGDIDELRVSVNGARQGTLGLSPGSSGTFPGTSATNNVIVVAKYANGAEGIVFQNPAL